MPSLPDATAAALSSRLPPSRKSAAQDVVFRTGVDLVTVDATVLAATDGRSRASVPADFVLKVDGQVRPVVSVEFVDHATSATRRARRSRRGTSRPNEDIDAGRLVVVAVDQTHIRRLEGRRRMTAAARFIDSLDPLDRVAVTSLSRHRAPSSFTRDRPALKRRLERDRRPGRSGVPAVQHRAREAVEIADGGRARLTDVVLRECGRSLTEYINPDRARSTMPRRPRCVSGAGGTGGAGAVAARAHAGAHLARRARGARRGAEAARRTEDGGAPVRRDGARSAPRRHVGARGGGARRAGRDLRAAHRRAALRSVAGSRLADAAARPRARRRRPLAVDRRDARRGVSAGRQRSGAVRADRATSSPAITCSRSRRSSAIATASIHRIDVSLATAARPPPGAPGVPHAGDPAIGGAAAAGSEPACCAAPNRQPSCRSASRPTPYPEPASDQPARRRQHRGRGPEPRERCCSDTCSPTRAA